MWHYQVFSWFYFPLSVCFIRLSNHYLGPAAAGSCTNEFVCCGCCDGVHRLLFPSFDGIAEGSTVPFMHIRVLTVSWSVVLAQVFPVATMDIELSHLSRWEGSLLLCCSGSGTRGMIGGSIDIAAYGIFLQDLMSSLLMWFELNNLG